MPVGGDPVGQVGAGGGHLLTRRVGPDGQHLHALGGQRVQVDVHVRTVVLVRGNLHISLEIPDTRISSIVLYNFPLHTLHIILKAEVHTPAPRELQPLK